MPGATTGVHVRDLRGFAQRTLTLARDAKGGWTRDGAAVKALKGCIDVDLGCSPSTNTLPIRRLRLAVGATKTIQAAWVQFPSLEVVKAKQTYTRLDEFTYRYASGTFEAELVVDEDGVVAQYAEWQRTAVAVGTGGLRAARRGSLSAGLAGRRCVLLGDRAGDDPLDDHALRIRVVLDERPGAAGQVLLRRLVRRRAPRGGVGADHETRASAGSRASPP